MFESCLQAVQLKLVQFQHENKQSVQRVTIYHMKSFKFFETCPN